MPKCSFYEICGRNVEGNPEEGLCVLHSTDPQKDESTFAKALEEHRKDKDGNFAYMVFPKKVDFSKARFTTKADFRRAGFSQGAFFSETTFAQGADFRGTIFTLVDFHEATFDQGADFSRAKFCETAVFVKARFSQGAIFDGAVFMDEAYFGGATFLGKTLFVFEYVIEGHQIIPIFSSVAVDFRGVTINPPDAIIFRGADLRKCQFLDTDLQKVHMIGVTWPQIPSQTRWPRIKHWVDKWPRVESWMKRLTLRSRIGVYDEIYALERAINEIPPWSRIEELYRRLKQSYEDRRDYERAGDFHYGEKEARRQDKKNTSFGLRLLLTFYMAFSGYGERVVRPLFCAGLLLAVSTFLYLWLGLEGMRTGGQEETLSLWQCGDWLQAAHYSFRTMTFLKTDDLAKPVSYARVVHTLQSLLGPLLFGLFALAVRQKLKR